MKYTVKEGQTLWDIAIEVYGASTPQNVLKIIQKNPTQLNNNLNASLYAGQVLEVEEPAYPSAVVLYYQKEEIVPNSGLTAPQYVLQYTPWVDAPDGLTQERTATCVNMVDGQQVDMAFCPIPVLSRPKTPDVSGLADGFLYVENGIITSTKLIDANN